MRHRLGNKKLNRTSEHRKALIKNMLNSLIKYEQIKTTLPKAKVLQSRLLGRFSLVHLQVGEGNDKVHLHARVPGLSYLKPDTIIGIEIDPVQTYVFS